MDYQKMNAKVIDSWVDEGWLWSRPVSEEGIRLAKQGIWDVVLTPRKPVPKSWFPTLEGCRLLGLASGGGQQMPIFSVLKANVTVLDYSRKQLDQERKVQAREGYDIELIQADMTKPLPFQNDTFDCIFHPVSNVYVESVESIFLECYRVLKPGGVLLCGLDNGINFIVDETEQVISETLPFNPLKNPKQKAKYNVEEEGYQFSHSLAENIGGQLKAGFRLTDIYDDVNTEGFLADHNIPCYYATRAVKIR